MFIFIISEARFESALYVPYMELYQDGALIVIT